MMVKKRRSSCLQMNHVSTSSQVEIHIQYMMRTGDTYYSCRQKVTTVLMSFLLDLCLVRLDRIVAMFFFSIVSTISAVIRSST